MSRPEKWSLTFSWMFRELHYSWITGSFFPLTDVPFPSLHPCTLFSDLQTQSESPEDKMLCTAAETQMAARFAWAIARRSLTGQPASQVGENCHSTTVRLSNSPHGGCYQIVCQQQNLMESIVYGTFKMFKMHISYIGHAGGDGCPSLWIIFLDIKDNLRL